VNINPSIGVVNYEWSCTVIPTNNAHTESNLLVGS